ncbi:hypothetical protein MMC06_005581 [Schaereria dolodes]|nr:hypothetical protein [Schaereria dolodes]
MSTVGNASMMPMSAMSMAFFTSTSTPLFSASWVPMSTGSYAGTCIFLIILAVIFRGLFAGKHILEHDWSEKERIRRFIVVRGRSAEEEHTGPASSQKDRTLIGERILKDGGNPGRGQTRNMTPWRLSVDLPRAAFLTVIVGVGYLLMVAVMTMNVGYFMSVLGGTFMGELLVGRYAQTRGMK